MNQPTVLIDDEGDESILPVETMENALKVSDVNHLTIENFFIPISREHNSWRKLIHSLADINNSVLKKVKESRRIILSFDPPVQSF